MIKVPHAANALVLGGRAQGDVVEVVDASRGGWRARVRVQWHQRLATEIEGAHSCTMVTMWDDWIDAWDPAIVPLSASIPVTAVVEARSGSSSSAGHDKQGDIGDPIRRQLQGEP